MIPGRSQGSQKCQEPTAHLIARPQKNQMPNEISLFVSGSGRMVLPNGRCSRHLDLIDENRQVGRLHDGVLGELFGVIGAGMTLKDQPPALNN